MHSVLILNFIIFSVLCLRLSFSEDSSYTAKKLKAKLKAIDTKLEDLKLNYYQAVESKNKDFATKIVDMMDISNKSAEKIAHITNLLNQIEYDEQINEIIENQEKKIVDLELNLKETEYLNRIIKEKLDTYMKDNYPEIHGIFDLLKSKKEFKKVKYDFSNQNEKVDKYLTAIKNREAQLREIEKELKNLDFAEKKDEKEEL